MQFAIVHICPPKGNHYALAEMAETVVLGLQALGHDCIWVEPDELFGIQSNSSENDRQFIIFGSNANPLYAKPFPLPRNSILYNFEQIYPESPWLRAGYIDYLCQYAVWDYSLANITRLKQLGIHHVAHVPVGYVPEMTRICPQPDPDIDVLFYGCINDRRQHILDELTAAGVKVEALFGVYGQERDEYISRSKIVLNMHFYEAKVFEIVRVSYLLANRAFVISERGSNPEEEAYFAEGVVFTDYENLVPCCLDYLAEDSKRQSIANKGFQCIQNCSEVAYLQQGLEALSQIQTVNHFSGDFIPDFYRKYLAKRAFYNGDYQQSIALYEETLQVDPLCLESYWTLGLIFRCLGEDFTAEMVWGAALEGTAFPEEGSDTHGSEPDRTYPDRLSDLVNFLRRLYQEHQQHLDLNPGDRLPHVSNLLTTIEESLRAIEAF